MSDLPDYIDRASILTEDEMHRLGLSPEAIDIVQALQFQLSEVRGSGDQLSRILQFFDGLKHEMRCLSRSGKSLDGINLGGLSKSCALILSALIQAAPRPLTKSQIHAALYDREAESHEKVVEVNVCKLRSPLRLIDIDIVTLWGVGYYISAEAAVRFHELLKDFEKNRSLPPLNWVAVAEHSANVKTFSRQNAKGEVSPNKHKSLIISLAKTGLNTLQILEAVKRKTGDKLNRLSLSSEICRWRNEGADIPYFAKRPRSSSGAQSSSSGAQK